MATTRTFNNNTIWGNSAATTSTSHSHPKRHNPTEYCLPDLLPQDVPTEIEFLTSGIEHRNRLKAVIKTMHPLLNPILFAITQEL